MRTHADYQQKLIELQNEQKALLASPDRRKRVIQERIRQLTKEFYDTKTEWREKLGWVHSIHEIAN
jgi:DNA gyrase/topoisomerase IV subunit A